MSLALGVIHSAMREVRRHLPAGEEGTDLVATPAD